ncbi:gluconate permease [Mycobacteroides abscessus]|nr:gluconate permease [Mycobacteroides abscessus]
MNAGLVLLAEQADVAHTTSEVRLLAAVLLSIGAIILLITRLRLHPFLALLLGSGTLAAVASVPFDKLLGSFVTGFGSTIAGVGLLIGLGAMLGRLLADSGGANIVADAVLARSSPRLLPWAVASIAAVLGLPLFFEVGVVLLIPIVLWWHVGEMCPCYGWASQRWRACSTAWAGAAASGPVGGSGCAEGRPGCHSGIRSRGGGTHLDRGGTALRADRGALGGAVGHSHRDGA